MNRKCKQEFKRCLPFNVFFLTSSFCVSMCFISQEKPHQTSTRVEDARPKWWYGHTEDTSRSNGNYFEIFSSNQIILFRKTRNHCNYTIEDDRSTPALALVLVLVLVKFDFVWFDWKTHHFFLLFRLFHTQKKMKLIERYAVFNQVSHNLKIYIFHLASPSMSSSLSLFQFRWICCLSHYNHHYFVRQTIFCARFPVVRFFFFCFTTLHSSNILVLVFISLYISITYSIVFISSL